MFTSITKKLLKRISPKNAGVESENIFPFFSHPNFRKILDKKLIGLLLILIITSLAACQSASPTPLTTSLSFPTSTPTATVTLVPMAIQINGSGITLAEFEAELARFQAAQSALGNTISLEQATQRVMDDLTVQVLLQQGAESAGFIVDDALLQTRIDNLVAQIGGMQALTDWEAKHGYSDESLRQALRRQIAAAWMRDQIISTVSSTTEQVHVQQILLYNSDTIQAVWNELNAGAEFGILAAKYDPVTKGELGWFPRNYLPDAQIEEAAFALQPGQYSNVIETPAGYSILMVLAREPEHILSPDALLTLQTLTLENWLMEKRQSSNITLAP
jgi:parvulin-like peptidyl-prolyl isomerase